MVKEKSGEFKRWPYKRVLIHLSFWAFYILFFGVFYGKYGKDYKLHLIETSVMLPCIMVATYVTIYGILPNYLKKRRLLISIFYVFILLFFVVLAERVFLRIINGLPVTKKLLWDITSVYLFLETNFMVTIAFTIKFYKIWYDQQEEKYRM